MRLVSRNTEMASSNSRSAGVLAIPLVLFRNQYRLSIRFQRLEYMFLIRRIADVIPLTELFRRFGQPDPRAPLGDNNMLNRTRRMGVRNPIGTWLRQ